MKYGKSKKLSSEKIERIHDALNGDDIVAAQLAIKDCVVYNITDETCVAALKKIKKDSTIKIVRISDLAIAALDILGIERYEGNDELVKELIDTEFYRDIKF